MSSINLVSEEMVLQESVASDRAKRDPAGREGEAGTSCMEGSRWCWAQCGVEVLLHSGMCSDANILSKEVPPAPRLCVSQIQARDGN